MTTVAEQRTKRRYGFPFRGLVAAVDRHEAPLGAIGQDSRDVLIEPGRVEGLGKVKRRHGSTIVSANTGATDTPVADATLRGNELFEMPTLISANGFPVIAGIFADESKRYGLLWHSDGGTDHVEGEEFGSTHYPTIASTQGNIKMPALPYDGNGATGYMRLAYEENRRRTIAGTRKRTGIKNREYFGGFQSCPSNQNREYNMSAGAGSNNLRRYPTGLCPPLWAPNVPAASYPTRKATAAPWAEGDKFWLTVAFEHEDGSVSMPFIPRDINATLTAGLGLITVNDDADGTPEYFDYIPLRDIAIGPPGTRRRRIYRSNKKSATQIAAGEWPDIGTLKLCAIIDDNLSTAFNLSAGSDGSLFTDPLLRTDQVWPSRGRYDWAFDQRHGTGYLRPNPCAIVLAPSGVTVSRDVNAQDDSVLLIGSVAFFFRITLGTTGTRTLRLRTSAFAGAPTETTLALTAALKVQDVVDSINSSGPAAASDEWVAQVVPGAPADAGADNLAPTHVAVANCARDGSATITTTEVTWNFANVAEGMKVSGTGVTPGTYVKTKNSNTSVTLSAAVTAGAAVTLEFYADTGDDGIVTDGTLGNIRCYGGSYFGIIAFTQSYLDTFPTEKRDFMVTAGGPTQRPNSANLFHASPGGRYQAESDAGIFMGGAPLSNGFVAFYSNRIGYYVNRRSGSTGEDADYRMKWVDLAHGCKSPFSIVYGNDWVGCWRDDGFWIMDSNEKQAILTGDIFDPVTGKGELNYEAGLCDAAAAADTTDFYMSAHYRDGRLWLNYRVDANSRANICYDASPSVEASGIAQLLTREGELYGWGARCAYSWRGYGTTGIRGVIGSARVSAAGVKLYQCDDTNDKTTGGLVQEFETTGGYTDGSDPVQWKIYTTRDMLGGMKKFSLANLLTVLYRHTVASGSQTVALVVYRDQQRLASTSYVLAITGSDTFTRKALTAALAARSAGEVVEFYFSGGAVAAERIFELSGIEADAEVLESLN